jgi:hypothetical protein
VSIRAALLLAVAAGALAHLYAVLHDGVWLAAGTGALTVAALALLVPRTVRWPLAAGLGALAVTYALRGVWYQPRPGRPFGWFSYSGQAAFTRSMVRLTEQSLTDQRWYALATLLWVGCLAAAPLRLPVRPGTRAVVVTGAIALAVGGYLAISLIIAATGAPSRQGHPVDLLTGAGLQVLGVAAALAGAVLASQRGGPRRLPATGLVLVALALVPAVGEATQTVTSSWFWREDVANDTAVAMLYTSIGGGWWYAVPAALLLSGTALVVAGFRPARPVAVTDAPAPTPKDPVG